MTPLEMKVAIKASTFLFRPIHTQLLICIDIPKPPFPILTHDALCLNM